MNRMLRRTGIVAFAAAVLVATGASSSGEADCQFEIRGSNNLSFDVWVDLYDSYVYLDGIGILGRITQLKIQNHRIASGKTMSRRYTAPGGCARKRDWRIMVRKGSAQQSVIVHTEGTTSTSRTVDIGPSSSWGR